MNPVERIASWLWDPTGSRRRAQRTEHVLTTRSIALRRRAHKRAVAQIRRTQELAQRVEAQH